MKKAGKLLTLVIVLLGAYWTSPPGMWAQTGNQAAVVVRFSDDRTETACVEFEEPQINGFDLLQRSGLNIEIEAQGLGALVCAIDDTGCPASDCLCQCRGGGDCIYWSYWHLQQNGWQYSQAGSLGYQIQSGAVDGWSWGPGAANQAFPPANLSFEEICLDPATNTPTPSPSPTITSTAAVIVVTPMAANTRSPSVVETVATDRPTTTPTRSATAVPTATASTIETNTPLPVQQATETSTVEFEPIQGPNNKTVLVETPTPLLPTESAIIINSGEDSQPNTPTVAALTTTSEPVAAAVLERADASVEAPPTIEPAQQIAAVTVEPAPQFTVIGSDVVPTVENVDQQSQVFDDDVEGGLDSYWFRFVIFLMIVVGLGTILYVVSRRRKQRDMP